MDLSVYRPDKNALNLVPEHIAKRYNALPVRKDGNTLYVAMGDASDQKAADDLRLVSHCQVRIVLAVPEAIGRAIEQYYGKKVKQFQPLIASRMPSVSLNSTVKTKWERNNRISALLAEPSSPPRAGVVLMHGYTMDKEKLQFDAEEMAKAGYLVIVPDLPLHGERALSDMNVFKYPYYGDAEGVVKLIENALADIDSCADYLKTRLPAETPLHLAGFSLGGCLTILHKARFPETFQLGVSVVGSAKVARLFFTSAITTDIRNDLIANGFDEDAWIPIVQKIEATEQAENIHNLLLIGVEDDDIVPVELIRDTYTALEHDTNECVLYEDYGHFTPMPLISAHALPFFERRTTRTTE